MTDADKAVVKTCDKHGELTREQVIKAGGTRLRCKLCMKDLHHNNYLANKEKIRVRTEAWRDENRERYRQLNRESAARHPEAERIRNKRYRDKHKERLNKRNAAYKRWCTQTLHDVYIKRLLVGHDGLLQHKDFTPEMVDVRRTLAKMRRQLQVYIKEDKNE